MMSMLTGCLKYRSRFPEMVHFARAESHGIIAVCCSRVERDSDSSGQLSIRQNHKPSLPGELS